MKRRVLFYALVLFFILPMAASAATPLQREGFVPLDTIDIWIDGWSNRYYYWTSLDSSDTIYVDIEVTSGSGIDFWICDDYNYDLWDSGYSSIAYEIQNNVGSVSTSFNVPYTDEWRVVFRNDDMLESKHIEGYVGLSPLYFPDSTANGVLAVVGFLAVIAVVTVICSKASESKHKLGVIAGQQTYPQYAPVSPPSQPPVSGNAKFCPYCGAPRQLFDAKFCQNCGRSFGRPDLGSRRPDLG